MFKKSLNWARRLAGKFSAYRTLIFAAYLIFLGWGLPFFYPVQQGVVVSMHNGFLLGLGVLGYVFLLILDSTALYDEDNLDDLVDVWVDLDDSNQKAVIDFADNLLDDQKIKAIERRKYEKLAKVDPEAFDH